jgi:excisionase family DNA binding protein
MLRVEERYYTPKEVAERLKVTTRTVYRWLESGDLRAIRFTREYRISETDLKEFIERHRTRPEE